MRRSAWCFAGLAAAAVIAGLIVHHVWCSVVQEEGEKDGLCEHLRYLMKERTIDALAGSLMVSGEELPNGTLSIGYESSDERPGRVTDIQRITSAGKNYVAVVVRQAVQLLEPQPGDAPPRVSPIPSKSQLAYLFDLEGHLLKRFGTPARTDGLNGDEVQVRTLGSECVWFVLVSHSAAGSELPREVRIYLLDDTCPTILKVKHHANGLAYTGTPEQAKRGVVLSFERPGSKLGLNDPGLGGNGRLYPAVVRWDEQKRLFYGPARVTIGSKLVYQVAVDESRRFRSIDLR